MITTNSNKFAKILPILRHNGHTKFNYSNNDYWIPAMSNVVMPKLNDKLFIPIIFALDNFPFDKV